MTRKYFSHRIFWLKISEMAMFSLVTALVSPSVMNTLQNKRDTLITLLKDNAGVLCTEPSGGMCLIQGQWDNIKKAHAILEEFYLHLQAEHTVRETLRPSNTGAVQPLLSFPMADSRWTSGDDAAKPRKHHVYVHPQSVAKTETEREASTPQMYRDRESGDVNPTSQDQPDSISLTDTNARQGATRAAGSTEVEVISDDCEQSSHGNPEYGAPRHEREDSPPLLPRQEPPHSMYETETLTRAPADSQAPMLSPTGSYSSYGSTAETVLSHLSSMQYTNTPPYTTQPQYSRNTTYKNALTIAASSMSATPPPPSLYNVNSAAQAAAHALGYGMLYPSMLQGIKQEPVSSGESDGNRSHPADDAAKTKSDMPSLQAANGVSAGVGSDFRCDICGRVFKSEVRMKEHKRIHNDNLVNHTPCPKCGKMFTYRHNMIVHLRRFHYGLQPTKRHICKQCGMRFLKPYMLRDHEEKVHHKPSVVVKKYVCTQCGAVFNNKNALAGHCSKVHISDAMSMMNSMKLLGQSTAQFAGLREPHYEVQRQNTG